MAGGCPARPVWARRTPPRVPRGDAPRRRRVRRQPADGAAVKARAAFTLMELLVAIVVAGIVALLVYGAAGAAIATQERLTARRAAAQTERAMRAVLTDALRNARSSTRFGETTLVIEDGATPAGRPAGPPGGRTDARALAHRGARRHRGRRRRVDAVGVDARAQRAYADRGPL